MIPIKSFINLFMLLTIAFAMGCVSKSDGDAPAGSPEIVNRLIANDITPADFQSRTQSIITLSYTSIDSELASSCTISHLNKITVTQACSCDGLGVCNVGVTGIAALTGAGSFSYNIVAGGKTSTTGKANFNITAPAAGSNVPPTISSISAQSTSEGTTTSAIAFTIGDSDSTVSCSNVTASSTNITLVPVASIVIGGSAPNCHATITPAANQLGSSNIVLTLTDTGTPLPAQTATASFTLTVAAVNDAPTISSISSQSTLEDTTLSGVAFTIGDVDSTVVCGNVKAVSTNTALLSNSNIIISGAGQSCTVSMAPNLNLSGTTSITLTVTDNGMPLPAKTAMTTFSLTVVAVNDPPVVATIATQNTTENVPKNVSFTITDVDSNLVCNSSVVITSSNTTLVPNTNISITGIAPNCVAAITPANGQSGVANLTVTVSDNGFPMPIQTSSTSFNFMVAQVNHIPTISSITNKTTNEDTATTAIAFTIADTDSTIYCSNVTPTSSNTTLVPNGNIVISGTAPNCSAIITPVANGYGSATITLTLNDNGTPMPAQTATSVFNLTVAAVNDAPTISTISNKTTAEGTASSAIAFTINDLDSTLSCTSGVAATSSNTTLIPNGNVVFSGTAPNCTAIVTPATTGNGTATLTFTVTDNGTPLPALTAATAFTMTVTQVNHAPTISTITAQSTNEDVATGLIAFTIADTDSTVYCSNVAGTSSNTTLVPNGSIVITGTAPNCTVKVTPTANAYGTVAITLTITDNGTPLPAQTATSAFNLTVNAVNDAPTISAISNKSTDEDEASNAITFTINDIDSSLICSSNVAATSSNTTVIPDANIVITGTAPNCQAVITSAANQSGSATITLTLSDNGTPMPALTATTNFVMTITPVPDLTGSLTLAANLSGVASSYSGNDYGRVMKFAGLISDESLSSFELCLGTAAGSCDVTSWVEATGYTTSGSAPTVNLGGSFKLVSGQNGAQVFNLTPSCSSTTNYYYSVRATNSSSRISNVLSTPAWSFWEPSCLGSTVLAQWLDASELSTITISSGTAVTSWIDKSGNNRTASQGTLAKQPAYTLASIGTMPGMRFNGTSSSMTATSGAFAYGFTSASFFTVIKANTVATNRYVFSEAGNATNNTYYAPLATTTSSTITGATVGTAGGTPQLNFPASSAPFFDGTVRLAMSVDTGNTFTTFSNGESQSQAATSYTRAASTIDTYRLGARLIRTTESGWFSGTIGEFIIINGTLTATQRQKLEGYSAHKWGVSANLPGAHPYLTVAP